MSTGIISELTPILQSTAALAHLNLLEYYTIYKEPDQKDRIKFFEELHKHIQTEAEMYQALGLEPKCCQNQDIILKIHNIIKLAFALRFSFNKFIKLSHLAGYIFGYPDYPPYYLLRLLLGGHKFDYELYKRELLAEDNVRFFLENRCIQIENFNSRLLQSFYLQHNRCKKTYKEAKEELSFQTDFVRFFFEARYIKGSLPDKTFNSAALIDIPPA